MVPIGSRSSSSRATEPRLDGLVERLTSLVPGPGWVVSCYLKLEPRDRQRGKYLVKLKNRIRSQLDALSARDPGREGFRQAEGDCARIQEFLADPGNLPAGRGIAVFACGPARLFESLPLAMVFRSRLAIDRTPLIRELQAVRDEFGRVLCAVADRASARLFEVTAAGAREFDAIRSEDATGSARFHGARVMRSKGARGRVAGTSGVGEHNWHHRIREERHRHFATVADMLFERTRRQPVQGIVLAGTGRDIAAVEPHLHPYVRELLLGTVRLNPQAVDASAVVEAVLGVRRQREREWERKHAVALREAVATGWGTAGTAATLDALARGQVRTLLVAADAACAGFRCGRTGRLTVLPDDCAGEGDPTPVPDIIDDAIEDALRQGVHVDVVEDSEARASFDGLGALLRFPRR